MSRTILPNRTYRSGTSWCLWRWTYTDSRYITRLHLIKTPWFAVCLHWLNKPDEEPWLHDHPVSFLSLILRGWYVEVRQYPSDDRYKLYLRRRLNLVQAHRLDRHCIVSVAPNTLTLALMGPKTREWGFHTDSGWVGWKDYYAAKRQMTKEGEDK